MDNDIQIPTSVWELINQAQHMFRTGNRNGAQSLLERGLQQVDRRNCGRTLALLSQLSQCLVAQRKYFEAVAILQEALQTCDQIPSERASKESRSVIMRMLGECLMFQRRYAEAEAIWRAAVDFNRKLLGNHIITATTINQLAVCLSRQRKYAEAEPYWQESMQMIGVPSIYGDSPITAVRTMIDLADCLSAQGKHAQAEPILERALQFTENVLNRKLEMIDTLRSRLARCRTAQGK